MTNLTRLRKYGILKIIPEPKHIPYDIENRPTLVYYGFDYDNAGNIQYRKTYAFTTAGTATSVSTTLYSTDNYTYGNANWGELLTAYKGTTISYDTIGNPLNYYNG